jgi:hypothetical protein
MHIITGKQGFTGYPDYMVHGYDNSGSIKPQWFIG